MNKVPKFIKKSEFLKNVATLSSGTFLAQLIPLLASPVISRLYSPDDFAVLALYLSIFNIIQIIVTGRYEMAIVLPKKETDAINVASLSMLITAIVSVMSLIVLYPLNDQLSQWLKNERLAGWIYLIPFAIFISGLVKTLNYWHIRKSNYRRISGSKISRSIGNVGVAVGFGKYLPRVNGLILGQFLGDLVMLFSLSSPFYRDFKTLKANISINKIKGLSVKHKEFPVFNTIHAFSDQFKESGIVAIISYFFLDRILGLYTFGLRYTKAPISLISQSLTPVVYQRLSAMKADGKALMPFVWRLTKRLVVVAIILFLGIFFLIEVLMAFIFGEEWRIAGSFIKILAPFLSLNFISSVLSFIPIVMGKQRAFFVIGLVTNIITVVTVLLSAFFFQDIRTTLKFMSGILSFNVLFILFWFHSLINNYDKTTNKTGK